MNRKILGIFVVFLAVAMLATPLVGPAIAKQSKPTYSFGLLGWNTDPGKEWVSGEKIAHDRFGTGAQNIYGSPWGLGTAVSTGLNNINNYDVTGMGIGHTVDTYATGTIKGIINYKVTGIGPFFYQGPTFTYMGVDVETGDMFIGVLFSGIAVKNGVSGELKGVNMRGNMVGVVVLADMDGAPPFGNPPELWDLNLVHETGTY